MDLEELERLRQEVVHAYVRGIPLVIVGAVVLMAILRAPILIPFIIIAGIIGIAIYASGPSKRFKALYKSTFVEGTLREVFSDLHYEPGNGMPKDVIRSTGMMRLADRYHSEDYVSGYYKNVAFEQADVHIEEEHTTTDSKGHTHTSYETIFRGRYMIFDFNKDFTYDLELIQKGFRAAKVPGRWFTASLDRMQMEDEDFNRRYKIYAGDGEEAFYILTPRFMEMIKRFDSRTNGKLLFCFVGGKLHVAVDDRTDSFECSVFRKIDSDAIYTQLHNEICVITDLIDDLQLDDDLFKH